MITKDHKIQYVNDKFLEMFATQINSKVRNNKEA